MKNNQTMGLKDSNKKEDINPLFKTNKNVVAYPILLECSKYFTDEFWKNLFEEMSYGKCPKAFYISNNTIYSSNKRKYFSYIIPKDKHASIIALEIKDLLVANTSICSVQDTNEKQRNLLEKSENSITDETTWSSIRKKNIRELFIIKFVIRMKEQYKLDWSMTRHLYSLIQLSFMFKTQSSKDVVFKNCRIESINGIVYNEKKGHFTNKFARNEVTKDKDDSDIQEDTYLYYYWDKYVITMSKLC